jgi:Cof subfamily protein (haloacid dehalogenase superfamily)
MIIVTDFDGTLYNDNHYVSTKNIDTLKKLEETGITRIIATGRSLYSVFSVIPQDFPIDYLIFSSGAGIMEWKTKNIINSFSLVNKQITKILDVLEKNNLNFMLHKKIPDNHYFYYFKASGSLLPADDFDSRCSLYADFAEKLDWESAASIKEASQFIVIISGISFNSHLSYYLDLKEKLADVEKLCLIRATSPLDKKSLWIEIFSENVSKAKAIKIIANMLDESYNNIAAIGNDFNDFDMLKWAGTGYAVGNAPDEIKKHFKVVKTNNENGFSEAVELFLYSKNKF